MKDLTAHSVTVHQGSALRHNAVPSASAGVCPTEAGGRSLAREVGPGPGCSHTAALPSCLGTREGPELSAPRSPA